MKKILLTAVFATACVAACFGITACNNSNNGQEPGHEHSYLQEVAEEKYLVSAATCVNKAVYYKSCTCGEHGEDTFEYGEVNTENHNYGAFVGNGDGKHTATCTREGCTESVANYAVTDNCADANADGKCEKCGEYIPSQGLEFTLNSDTDTYSVKSKGSCKDTRLVIPATYNGKNVTVIEEEAFYNCAFTNAIIPDSIKSIGYGAFESCYNLKSITIGNGVTSIGSDAFYHCYNLKSITIGSGVTSIGNYAFYRCDRLVEVINKSELNIEKGSSNYGYLGYYALIVHNGESKLVNKDDYSFITDEEGKHYLLDYEGTATGLTLPANYNGESYAIYNNAFDNCDSITSVIIPDSVTSIGRRAFYGCPLTSVIIPDNVESIGEYAFAYCESLISVTIGSGVTSIGGNAFYFCNKLIEIVNKSQLTIENGSYAAYRLMFVHNGESKVDNKDGYFFVTDAEGKNYLFGYSGTATELTLPANYNGENYAIGNYAFADCDDIISVTIPDGVTSIGDCAFNNCDNLKSVTIGKNVESIGENAFSYCKSLISITIGSGVTSIGEYAFGSCDKLVEVINKSKLTVTKGSEDYGYLGYYALVVHNGESKIVNKDGYFFITDEEDNNYLLGYGGTATELTLPAKYNGENYAIYNSAFADCDDITSVTISDGVTSIGNYAFANCYNLKTITIGENVESIGDYAFDDVRKLQYNEYENAYYLGNESNKYMVLVDLKDTSDDTPITSCKIHESTKFIYDEAFKYCEDLKSITIPNGVIGIGREAFSYSGLTSITIPNSVVTIGYGAFEGCYNLRSVTIGNGVTSISNSLFYECSGLTSVTIPDGVTDIGDYAFNGCVELLSVTIGSGVTSIDDCAFEDCNKLVEVINKSALNIEKGSYENGYVAYYAQIVHNGESKIVNKDGYLFMTIEGTNYLLGYNGTETELTLPANYNGENYDIGDNAFANCDDITSVTIPDGVTRICNSAFNYCLNLKSVTIGNGVTDIGMQTFYNCYNLATVTIGSKVTYIGYQAFNYCNKLVEVINKSELNIEKGSSENGYVAYYALVVHNGESKIVNKDDYSFITDAEGKHYLVGYNGTATELTLPANYNGENYAIGNNAFAYCEGLTSVIIPDGVTSIGDYAFYYCSALTTVTIGNDVTKIGDRAFYNCCNLATVTIGNGVKDIGNYAFFDCYDLATVTIGSGVTSIGNYAFHDCYGLETVYYVGTESGLGSISIGDSNNYFTDVTKYYYSETQPAESGNYWHYVDGVPTAWTAASTTGE